jgi:hypothetical protein
MLACRERGATADRLLLPEHPIRVLLLRANDLRFGARSANFLSPAAAFIAIVALMVAMALFACSIFDFCNSIPPGNRRNAASSMSVSV